ncbi:DNA adenine methylase [Raineya orbicola]|jgi:adenine-specific DNA-methyltransferase|uniref:site-specific DNA-methyltransferase (adenine-specific) n=1 Tax=Raineya orbicola TaxID=2016530 RepID=A0A2N3IHC3_9BACT|nr:DNA adenine methylase [Raineya orbicola]PKQ69691.1 Adenine-specific DNA methylase [Raineya orbicola]
MNYIGSKYKLIPFIRETILEVVGQEKLSKAIFYDAFAGTGVVGRVFKSKVKKIIASDTEYYAFVLNRNYIQNHQEVSSQNLYYLNTLEGKEGFIYQNYSEKGSLRNYFSAPNGKKIDAIRTEIENLKNSISEDEYFFLLCSLLESADKVANTASVYGAFLKQLKKSAQKPFFLEPAHFEVNHQTHEVYHGEAEKVIEKVSGDILYLDPPYNTRQYGSNYHLLNTIALYDHFEPQGKTGLRPNYYKSLFCSKQKAPETLEKIIAKAQFKYIFLSYNNEGIIPLEKIQTIMRKYGTYEVFSQNYNRFMADKPSQRSYKANYTTEFLHFLEKKH